MKIHEIFARIDRGEYLFGRIMSIIRIVAYATMILAGFKIMFGIGLPYEIIMAILIIGYIPFMLVLERIDGKFKIWESQNEYTTEQKNPYFKDLKKKVDNIEKGVNGVKN